MAAAPQLIPGTGPSTPLAAVIRDAGASGSAAAVRRRPVRATDEVESTPPTILVVEPDERTRSLLFAGLSPEGFNVVGVASAEEALRFLSPDRPVPALVFCEAELRGEDGFSLCGHIRAEQRTADVPVVVLSRSPESHHRDLAGGAGADQYLPKPLFLNDVIALARLMAGRSSSLARFDAHTDVLPLSHALRALLSGIRSGRVELERGSGFISFREGQVVDAFFDGARGERALNRMLLLGRGEYVVSFGPALTRATMSFGVHELVTRTLPRLKRWETLVSRSVPLDARLVVDFARLAELLDQLPDDVNGLVRLCDGRRPVNAVVLQSNLDEVTALEALTRLYAMGVLTPFAETNVPGKAPTLFEPEPFYFEAPQAPAKPETLYEAAGVIDDQVRQQLEAFRIKPVVEPREQKVTPILLTQLAQTQAQVAEPAPATALEQAVVSETEVAVLASGGRRRATLFGLAVVALGAMMAIAFWPGQQDVTPPAEQVVAGPALAEAPVVVSSAVAPVVNPASAAEPLQPMEALAVTEATEEGATEGVPPSLLEAIAFYETGRYRESIALLEEITGADPSLTQAWIFLGLAHFDAGRVVEAERAAQKAIALDPDNGRVLMLMASIHLDAGDKVQAKAKLRRYLELYPNGAFAREAQQLLAR